MPPKVGSAGVGPGPVTTNAGEEIHDIKSTEVEKKSAEVKQDASKNETAAASRSSAKEATNRKAELSAGAASQQIKLNRKLKEKEGDQNAGKSHKIYGTRGDDNIHISRAPQLLGALGLYEVDVNGSKQYLTKRQLGQTEIHAGDGNDSIVVDSNVTQGVKIHGGRGNDVIIGGGGNDNINGGSGNDIIAGRGGSDNISGGRGNDWITGGRGNDKINGGSGNDYIKGGKGKDVITSGGGNDRIDE